MKTTRDWIAHTLRMRHGMRATRHEDVPDAVGALALSGVQRRAVARLVDAMNTHDGAILADSVGMGKTRVALAAALQVRASMHAGATQPIGLCIPARLRSSWERAVRVAGLLGQGEVEVLTHTALSRGRLLERTPCALIVDEAHRFRNPSTRRAQGLSRLASEAPCVLVTATPICNSVWDLYHLLRLFLPEHALRDILGMDLSAAFCASAGGNTPLAEALEEVVVRRTWDEHQDAALARPRLVMDVVAYAPHDAEQWMWRNLEDAVRRLTLAVWEGAWPRGLFAEFMLRRWESAPEALEHTLDHLCLYHERWLEGHQRGAARLTRARYRALYGGERTQARQNVLPFLWAPSGSGTTGQEEDGHEVCVEDVRGDLHALRTLRARTREVIERGSGRRRALEDVLTRFPQDKLLVFTGFRDAARAIYDDARAILGARGRVAMVTGSEARATGLGAKVSADEIVRRFAPSAQGIRWPGPHHEVQVLVATDCLAEGVDLQDCGRVMLADLPYSPLRVEQRVGRLVRPGGPHDEVVVHLPRPTSWRDSLGLRRRLQDKLAAAERGRNAYDLAGVVAERPAQGSPLDTMDALDRLRASLVDARGDGRSRRRVEWWRGVHDGADDVVWLFAEVIRGSGRASIGAWWRVSAGAERVSSSTQCLLDSMIALCDRASPITEHGAPDDALTTRATQALAGYEAQLRAVHLAPAPVRAQAREALAAVWASLEREVREGRVALERGALEELRAGIFSSHTRGAQRRLARLARSAPDAMWMRELQRVLARAGHSAGPPRVVPRAGLWLRARRARVGGDE